MKGHTLALLIIITAFGVIEIGKFIYNYKKTLEENDRLKSGELDWSEV